MKLKTGRGVLLVLLTGVISLPDCPAAVQDLAKAVISYAQFDGQAQLDFAVGNNKVSGGGGWVFEDGKCGKGVKVGGTAAAPCYYTEGNILPDRGTIAFWMKPEWNGTSGSGAQRTLFRVSSPPIEIGWSGENGRIRFGTWTTGAGGDEWDWDWRPSADAGKIRQGGWHHVAVTWGDKEKRIFIDGAEAAKSDTTFIDWVMPGSMFSLGAETDGSGKADAVFDELVVWDHPLTPEEVREVYSAYRDDSKAGPFASFLAIGKEDQSEATSCPLKFSGSAGRSKTPLFYRGEEVTVSVDVFNASDANRQVETVYELINYRLKPVRQFKKHYKIAGGGKFEEKISFTMKDSGIFKLIARCTDSEGKECVEDIAIFGVLPQKSPDEDILPTEDSPFGVHTRLDGDENSLRYLDIARKVGIGWIRIHDFDTTTWWNTLEPEKGTFIFQDDHIDLARKYGFYVLGIFEATPFWAATAPPGTTADSFYTYRKYPAKDIKDWENYVTTVVSHFKDRIKYWEVQNEADIGPFWAGTAEEYAEYVKISFNAAKKVDPSCVVLAGGALPIVTKPWTEKVFKSSALNYMDKLSFHGYGEGDGMGSGETTRLYEDGTFGSGFCGKVYEHRIDYLKDLMGEHGEVKPMWDTETTVFGATFYSKIDRPELPPARLWKREAPSVSAGEMVKLFVTNFGRNIDKVFYYYLSDPTQPPSFHYQESLLEHDGAPTAKLMAYATLTRLLTGSNFAGKADLGTGVYGYVFQTKAGSVAVLWSQVNGKTRLNAGSIGRKIDLVDVMCNFKSARMSRGVLTLDLNAEPVFLRSEMPAKEMLTVLQSAKVMISDVVKLKPVMNTKAERKFAAPGVDSGRWTFVDLRPHMNMGFRDEVAGDEKGGWTDEGSMNDMKDIPLGRQTFAGVPFDITDPGGNNGHSCITMRGRFSTPGKVFPEQVTIPFESTVERLYFLHAASWCQHNNSEVARYVVTYEDGSRETVGLYGGKNVADWYASELEDEESIPVGIKTLDAVGPETKYLRAVEWRNPHPDMRLRSITLKTNSEATLILLAITGLNGSAE